MSLAKDKFKALGKKSGANQTKKKNDEKLTDEQREALGFAVDVIAVDSIGISKVNDTDEVWNKQAKQKDTDNDDELSSVVSPSSPNTDTREEEKPKLFRASGSSRVLKTPEVVSTESLPSLEDIASGAVSLAPTPVPQGDKVRKITPFDPFNPNDKKISGGSSGPKKHEAPKAGVYVPGVTKLGRKITPIEEFSGTKPAPVVSNQQGSGVYKPPSSSSTNHSFSLSSPTVSSPLSSGNSNVYRPPCKTGERKYTPMDDMSSKPLPSANTTSDNPNLYRPGRMRRQGQQ